MAGPGDGIAAGAGCRGYLRASHADREQVIGTLKAGFVQGMLAKDEFDLRVGEAFASQTYAELAAVTADLPAGLTAAQALSRVPRGVRDAVRYMRLGAVLDLAVLVTIVVTLGSVRSAASYEAAVQWHTVMATQVVPVLASAAIRRWRVAVAGLGGQPGL